VAAKLDVTAVGVTAVEYGVDRSENGGRAAERQEVSNKQGEISNGDKSRNKGVGRVETLAAEAKSIVLSIEISE